MKKLAVTLCLSALALGAFAQGTVNFQNGVGLNISTNSTDLAGGTSGNINAATGPYYFALFTASSTVNSMDANLQNLRSAAWSFTIYGTNTGTAGRMSGGAGVTVNGWNPGETNSYIVLGWSANLGNSWAQISTLINGMTRSNNTFLVSGAVGPNSFLGASAVGFGQAGGASGPNTFLPWNIYGTSPTAAGTPVPGFSLLNVTNVPEPTTFGLAGLGAAALMIFRRRKA
jgi:hypothetical protein